MADCGIRSVFSQVHDLLKRQSHGSLLERYFKREDILREISDCGTSLNDALIMFSVRVTLSMPLIHSNVSVQFSVQMRILKQVKETEVHHALQKASGHVQQQQGILGESIAVEQGQLAQVNRTDAVDVLPALRTIHRRQKSLDQEYDMAHLRTLMHIELEDPSAIARI
jgi:hypothetical protein